MPLSSLNTITEVVPSNPAALDFEEKFRYNLETFLGQMKLFEQDYQGTVSELTADGSSSFSESFSALNTTTNLSYDTIVELLEGNEYSSLPQNQSFGAETTLRFDSLSSRFQYTDSFISRAYSDLVETGKNYISIEDRFQQNETRIKANEDFIGNFSDPSTDILDIKQDIIDLDNEISRIDNLYAVDIGTYTTIDGRFDNAESLITDLNTKYAIDSGSYATLNLRFLASENSILDLKNNYSTDKGSESSIHDRLVLIENDVTDIQSNWDIDRDTYNSIDERIDDSENRLTLLENQYTTDHSTFNSIDERIDDSESRVGVLENAYTADKGTQTSIDDRFTILENNYSTDKGSHSSIDLRFGDHALLAGDPLQDFSVNNLNIAGTLGFTGQLDMNSSKIINLPLSPVDGHEAVSKNYVDTKWQINSTAIANLGLSQLPGASSGYAGLNDKWLTISNGVLTWGDAPNLDPNVAAAAPYEWLPQVAFQAIQFDGEVYSSNSLAAGFTYYVAGNLYIDNVDENGNPLTLTLESTNQVDSRGRVVNGATLIVQGHVVGNLAGIQLDSTYNNKPRLIVQNWSDSKADYLIQEVSGSSVQVKTSELNLEGSHYFPSRLVLEANTEFIVDTDCQLTFKELVRIDNITSLVTLQHANASIKYIDPIASINKLIDGAPAAYDTLVEISSILENSDGDTWIDVFSQVSTDLIQHRADIDSNDNDIVNINSEINNIKNDYYLTTDAQTWVNDETQYIKDDLTNNYYDSSVVDQKLVDLKADIEGNSELVKTLTDLQESLGDNATGLNSIIGVLSNKADANYTYTETLDSNGNVTEIIYDYSQSPTVSGASVAYTELTELDSRVDELETSIVTTTETDADDGIEYTVVNFGD